MNESITVAEGNCNSRKRKKRETKREAAKKMSYSLGSAPLSEYIVSCSHKRALKKVFQCEDVTLKNINECRQKIFSTTNKTMQDQRLCLLLGVTAPKRNRPRPNSAKKKPHNLHITYQIAVGKKGGAKQVCQKFFLANLELSKFRVIRLAKILLEGGIPVERRGGDKVLDKNEGKKEAIRNFIKN